MDSSTQHVFVEPEGSLEVLSQIEMELIGDAHLDGLKELFRRCSLAILNCSEESDDPLGMLERYKDYSVNVVQGVRGIRLELLNAPTSAFVDGEMMQGIKRNLFALLRDLIYMGNRVANRFDLTSSNGVTNAVFHILRNARIWDAQSDRGLVVCWGGHSIDRVEYEYTKKVGYELGLRALDVCTGCGPGAMKGPMKGAAIGHAKQRISGGRYIGISEPGIIASESPNPIVNHLVVMPDIEKRLEAFIRSAHGIVVFPGGVGTAEEVLFVLGVLVDPRNAGQNIPLVLTGPEESASYFQQLNRFIETTLGKEATQYYEIIVNDPVSVAHRMTSGIKRVKQLRQESDDAFYFNWLLHLDAGYQTPFVPNHQSVAELMLVPDQDMHEKAATLRRLFSAIVAGNVKEEGIRAIAKHGPFEINGDHDSLLALDELLSDFAKHNRMKLAVGAGYVPCYRLAA